MANIAYLHMIKQIVAILSTVGISIPMKGIVFHVICYLSIKFKEIGPTLYTHVIGIALREFLEKLTDFVTYLIHKNLITVV